MPIPVWQSVSKAASTRCYSIRVCFRCDRAQQTGWPLCCSDWLGQNVEVEQFAGRWLDLGRDQMTALPKGGVGQFNRLGVDAAIGARAWDVQSGVTLRIGPLDLSQFEALLPGRALLTQLAGLARLYLGDQVGFAINPVLAAAAVPKPALGTASRLGWTSWLPVSSARRGDGTEAKFTSKDADRGRTAS